MMAWGIASTIAYLHGCQMIGFKRLTEVCQGLFGLTISQGAIANVLARVAVLRQRPPRREILFVIIDPTRSAGLEFSQPSALFWFPGELSVNETLGRREEATIDASLVFCLRTSSADYSWPASRLLF
jgi:hypothetical protein